MATKTYYHNVPNSRYVGKDGTEHFFRGGQLTTDDPIVIADLDKVIADGCTVIRDKPHGRVDKAALTAKTEVDRKAETTAAALAALKSQGQAPDALLLKPATEGQGQAAVTK